MAQVAIRTEKLVHTYPRGNVMALKGVDLEIYVGDILSIVGQNGSGKTTLVRHFNGLLRPTSGKVYRWGRIPQDRQWHRCRVGADMYFRIQIIRYFAQQCVRN